MRRVVRVFAEALVMLLAFSVLYILGSLLIHGRVDWY